MENFKFILFSVLIIVLLGGASYWAFSTMESGSTHVSTQKQKELEQKNIDLEKQMQELAKQNDLIKTENTVQPSKTEEVKVTETPKVATTTTPTKVTTPTKAPVLKYQSLINDIQKLINANVTLKLKSQGAYVGTVQKFLNIYNNTSNKVDNDYGPSMVTLIKNFQKAQGLTMSGTTSSTSYKKMISYLKTK